MPIPRAPRWRQWWEGFWMKGGVVDFTGSKHPKAPELERRIVLSQYLTAVNSAGALPPQEEGLFSNSWNGKFHLEMHAWHEAHFAVWGRPELLERSMPWYLAHLEEAKARAKANGAKGAWWPKMVGPEGRESPSTVNPFIMWQQPHPIYLAETLWIARGKDQATLEKYSELVFQTADLLASWPFYDKKAQRYILGPPVIPAQENFDPLTTFNPDLRARVLAIRHRHRAALARAAGPAEESEVGRRVVPALEAAREGRHLPGRRVAAGSVGARAVRAMLEGRRAANVRTAIIPRSWPRWDCCPAGARIARPCAAP